MIWNNLLQEFIDIAAIMSFRKNFDGVLVQLVDILNTLFKYWMSYRQLTFITETSELMMKCCAVWFVLHTYISCVTACSLKKLNFKI